MSSCILQLGTPIHIRNNEETIKTPLDCNSKLDAHLCSFVTLCDVVCLVGWLWTSCLVPIAHGRLRAVVFSLALDVLPAGDVPAGAVTARALAGTALSVVLPLAPPPLVLLLAELVRFARPATLLCAFVIVEAAVALFSLLHDLVPAEGAIALSETVWLATLGDGVENCGNVGFGTVRKFVVVVPVSRGGGGEHDVVPLGPARTTAFWPIVL